MLEGIILNKRLFIFFLISQLHNISLCSQNMLNDSIIIWSKDYRLNIKDFQKETTDENDEIFKIGGVCTSALAVEQIKDLQILNVNAIFYKKSSFIEKNEEIEDVLLEHEQIHFDITELYARKFRKWLFEMYNNEQNVNEELLLEKFNAFNEQHSNYQIKFDEELNYSIYDENQKKWQEKIKKELELLEPYSYENYLKTIEEIK